MMTRTLLLTLLLTLLIITGCKTSNLAPTQAAEKLGPNPYFEIDGRPVTYEELAKHDASEFAALTAYYGKDATKNFGEKAKDGAVTMLTRGFATNKFETFFASYSKEFADMIKVTRREEIQYVLNDRVLTTNFEGDLALIDKKLMKELKVIDQKVLMDKFNVKDKKIGVIVKANRPKDLYNSKDKF